MHFYIQSSFDQYNSIQRHNHSLPGVNNYPKCPWSLIIEQSTFILELLDYWWSVIVCTPRVVGYNCILSVLSAQYTSKENKEEHQEQQLDSVKSFMVENRRWRWYWSIQSTAGLLGLLSSVSWLLNYESLHWSLNGDFCSIIWSSLWFYMF